VAGSTETEAVFCGRFPRRYSGIQVEGERERPLRRTRAALSQPQLRLPGGLKQYEVSLEKLHSGDGLELQIEADEARPTEPDLVVP
jgi:hypothetical protein